MEKDEKVENLVDSCKKGAVNGMEQFLKVFSFVAEDRLHWTPTPTAKSALQIAAHTATYPANFAKMIRDRKIPTGEEINVFVAQTRAAEQAITDRTEIEPIFRKNTDEVLAALDSLTPDEIGLSLDSSLGWSMPMTFLMSLPGIHAYTHTGQIDYLQTCWAIRRCITSTKRPKDTTRLDISSFAEPRLHDDIFWRARKV